MTRSSSTPHWHIASDTVIDVFRTAARTDPDQLYCKTQDMQLSYAETARAVDALARSLGMSVKGRVVALILPNSPAFLVAYFGVLAAGAQPALVNYGHPDATVQALLTGLDVAVILSDRKIPGLEITSFDDSAAAELAQHPQTEQPELPVTGSSDIAAILFSGGTTGLPKQMAHSNRALIAKMEAIESGWTSQEHDIWLPVAPFTHVYGFLMGVLNPVLRACSVVIPARFQPDLIVETLQSERVTIFGGGPPAIYQAVMAATQFGTAHFPDLRVCPGGGAPFPLDVLRRWEAATGLPIVEGYGMTEIAPISINADPALRKPGTAGRPVPGTVIEIVDIQTGETVLPAGDTGEIRVKGPHMMTEYLNNPEETAQVLRHGFVYTGDIGTLDDDGFVRISDRKKDVLFVKGFNVFPREVEEVLLTFPSVSGACVVGRADDRSGEVPVAYITLRDTYDADALHAHCAAQLTAYKIPAQTIVLDSLPLTPAGKVDRLALRQRAAEHS